VKKIYLIGIALMILLLFAWSPWITKSYAETKVENVFTSEWEGVMDGCGFNCNGCGITESSRTLFGYSVEIEYACGMLPADTPEYHRQDSIFVSCLGTIHGINHN